MNWKWVGVATMALAAAACGTDRTDRVYGGAAAGAATGAGVGALGGPVGALAGAAIGGGAGAVTGATTTPSDVNLGRPPWSNPEVRTPLDDDPRGRRGGAAARSSDAPGRGDVRLAQEALQARGFDAGQPDGVMGPQTAGALRDFQRSNNLPVTGRLDGRTMQALNVSGGAGNATAATPWGGGPARGGVPAQAATPAPRVGDPATRGAVGTGTGATTVPSVGGGASTGTFSGGSGLSSPGASPTGTGSTGPGGSAGVGTGVGGAGGSAR
jgi:peptidoglycan hydrolase-like protein with peptidoglycan-binding domain